MVRNVDEELVILDLKTAPYLGLDSPVQSAHETLQAESNVDPKQLNADLEKFVQKLVEFGLVEPTQP
jgi:hypothetical protein